MELTHGQVKNNNVAVVVKKLVKLVKSRMQSAFFTSFDAEVDQQLRLLSDLTKRVLPGGAPPKTITRWFTRLTTRHFYLLGSLLLINVLWLLPSAQVENPAQVLPLKENSAQKAELSNVVSAEQSALAEGEKTSAEKDGDEADDGDETSDARDSNADSDADGGDGDGDGDGDNDEDAEEETTTAAPRPAAVRTTTEAPKELPGAYKRLWAQLRKQPTIFTRRRLKQRGQISCGGSGCVVYKTWDAISFAHPALNLTLPQDMPPLASIASMVEGGCKRGSKDPSCNPKSMREIGRDSTSEVSRPRCAVVGNSGKLRWEQHGAAIDATDIVIRFNQGRTKGFERQVGRKSTFRIYNGPYVEPKQAGEVTIAQLRDPAIKAWVKSVEKHSDVLAYMFDPEFLCLAWQWAGKEGDKPSSGLVGILFALSMCRFVDVYGFQYDAYFDETMRPHYYDWERPKPGRENAHPFSREMSLYLLLQATGKLKLH
ncbi:beta-galactoside alpha-2,3-sialyltransferase [Pycnococcus provasolii]